MAVRLAGAMAPFSLAHLLVALGAAAASSSPPRSTPRSRAGHGFRSSKPWLPRESVTTAPTASELVAAAALPESFDWRDVRGRNMVTTDLNQHIPQYCGACWIHGTVSSLNDRIKIMRGGKFPDVMLGRQSIMNCVPDPNSTGPPPGCDGGDAWMIHKYMHEHPVPDATCLPYAAKNMGCEPMNVCRNCFADGNECFPIQNWTEYGVGDYGNVTGELAMMKEIYARGPIACSAATDDLFMLHYPENEGVRKDNVYITDANYTNDDIDHVMSVTGWGTTPSGVKFWIVRNSWGTYWGDKGWVKIRRGVNQQLIESDCDWAVPTFRELEEEMRFQVLGDYTHGTQLGKDLVAMQLQAAAEGPWAPGANLVAAAVVVAASSLAFALSAFYYSRRVLGGTAPRQPALLG